MNKKIILFVALETEFSKDLIPAGVEIHYTGVGKVNAAIKATSVLCNISSKDTIVLNYGSAGSNILPRGTLVECKYFIQNDMKTPFGIDNETPFDYLIYPEIKEPTIHFGSGYVCRTQDTFEKNPNGIFDMEAYSIAKVCKIYGFDFVAYKYISDGGDVTDWEENCSKGSSLFLNELNHIFNVR